jgi:exosortase
VIVVRSLHRVLGFYFLIALSCVLCRPAIGTLLQLAWSNDAYTYLLLIPLLSLGLIYTQRECISSPYESSLGAGVPVLLIALLIGASPSWLTIDGRLHLSLTIFSLVLWCIGSVIVCFGFEALRCFLFPLCFLFLLVPLSQPAVNRVIEFLQYQSATAAEFMFRLAGESVVKHGLVLSIPGLDIEVAPECSSIRTSELLVVTTIILAQLFLRSWWKRVLLILAAIPLSIAKNGFRIFTIAELGTRVNPGFLNGRLHQRGGLLFYGLAVILVLLFVVALRRIESHAKSSENRTRSERAMGAP